MVLDKFIEEIEKKEQHLCNSTDLTAGLRVNLKLLSGVSELGLLLYSLWVRYIALKSNLR